MASNMDALKHGKTIRNARELVKKIQTPKEIAENATRREQMDEQFKPLVFIDNNALVAPDWHIGFHCRRKMAILLKVAEEYKVKRLIIPGDFFDCDEYKKFIRLSFMETFQLEKKMAGDILKKLLETFKEVDFSMGNHEFRWLAKNEGMSTIQDLFAITGVKGNYKVTTDDFITLYSNGEKWRLSHPSNFSPTPLSVASRLADVYRCNILCAHGHQFNQGYSKSGEFQIVDGGGMFDMRQAEYLRKTTCHPAVHSGFYLIQDGYAIPFDGGKERKT